MPLTKIDDRGLTTPVDLQDSEKLRFGTGNDFEVYHDGTNSIQFFDAQVGAVRFRTDVGNSARTAAQFSAGVDLYYDNVKKFETISTGVQVTGEISHLAGTYTNASGGHVKIKHDSGKLTLGAGEDLEVLHDGSNSRIKNTTGQLQLRSDTIALENAAGNGYATITGISFADNGKARWGNNDDLQIYHDGSHTYLKGFTGFTFLYGASGVALHANSSDYALHAASNGATKLYYDGSAKLETSSTGNLSTGVHKFITGNGSQASDANVLHVVAGSTSNRGVMIGTGRSTGASQNDGMGYIDAIDSESGGYGAQLQLRANGNKVMVIGYQGNNNVGINELNPSSRLHVTSDSTAEGIKSVHSNGQAGIGIGYNTIMTCGTNSQNQLYIRAKGNEKVRLGANGHDILGLEKDSRDVRVYKNAQGWSTLEMQADQSISGGLRKHVRHLNNGQNSVSTHNLFRLRRHNWGVGFFEVRIYYAYYSGSYMSRWRVMGHGAGGDHYSVLQVEEKFTNGSGANWGATIQKTTGSSSSPGDSSTYYTDIQATLPNYTYAVCEMILSSGYQTDNASSGNSMSSNSYTLWTP